MTTSAIYYRLRIRNAANTADVLLVSSVRGDTLPWIKDAPQGDGQEFDPLTGASRCGAFTGSIVDGITSGTSRVVTSQLEDAGFRQQLMDRRAFLEWSNNGSTWTGGTNGGVLIAGFLTGLRLVSAIEYSFTVSDPTRAEHSFMAFAPQMVIDSVTHLPRMETILEFLARWPNRGCIFGGPVRGGFRNQPDRGGWEMTIDGQNFGQALLTFVAGYAPPDFKRSTSAQDCMSAANSRTDDRFQFSWNATTDQAVTFADALAGSFRDIVVEVIGSGLYQAMSGVGYFPFTEFASDNAGGLQKHLCKDIRHRGIYIGCKTSLAASGLPGASSSVRVRAFTATASDISPIYWTGHPVDLLAKLWGDAGLDFDAAAIETVRHAIGDDLRLSIRVRAPQNLGTFLESTIYAPLGVGVRTNPAGQLQAFAMRAFPTTIPTTTILAADVQDGTRGGNSGPVFSIDESTAVKTVTFEHERLILAQDASSTDAVDGFVTQSERWEITNSDTAAPAGTVTQSYQVAGMLDTAQARGMILADRVSALARQIFDRYGRGLIVGELTGLRGGATDTVQLGDEILNQLPQLPNHNKRLGDDLSVSARRMQVVRITPTPSGPQIKLADSGPNTQPYATAPTVTIAASTNAPLSIAVATITNAATLNAVPAGARVQMATGSSPLGTAYTDVIGFNDGAIPTTAFPLPAVAPGTTVWVRCRTELAGSQPSSWSTPVSVTLSAIPAVSGLSVTPSGSDGSTALVNWTVGDTTSLIEVYLRASGASVGSAIRQQVLPAGSNQFILERLTPGNAYTVGVLARNASGDVSTTAEATFTAGASTVTLPAPVYPAGFCGSHDPLTGTPQRDAIYGIAVVAAAFPGFIEVAVAIETSVGSGTYGSFATIGQATPSVLGDWTVWQDVAPNDGLRRQLQARHIRTGATSSTFTTVVTVLPWTPQALPVYPTQIILSVNVNTPGSDTLAQTRVSVSVAAIDPQGGPTMVALSALTGTSSVISGLAIATYGASPQTWVLARPGVLKGSASAQFTGDTNPVGSARTGTATVDLPEQGQQGAPVLVMTVGTNGNPVTQIIGNNDTLSYTWAESISAIPSDATAIAGTLVNGTVVTITSAVVLAMGASYYFKAVPWPLTSAGGTHGIIVSGKVDRQSKSTAKTILINWPWFHAGGVVTNYDYGDDVHTTDNASVTLYAPVDIPPGATIASFSAEMYSQGAADVANLKLQRFNGSGAAPTQIGSTIAATTGSASWTSPSSSFTEVTGTAPYHLQLFMQAITSGNQGARLSRATITYTQPDLTVSR